ncbi:MAG TPA: carboxypeptidase regulatory-like domain-containing protein [Candidatus Acidoferrum sp.]
MRILQSRANSFLMFVWGIFVIVALAAPARVAAQATISTGNIQGTIVDPQGAAVAGAKVTITNKATKQVFPTTTNSTGFYSVGALSAGDYSVHVELKGFKSIDAAAVVQIGVVSTVNLSLEVGSETAIVEVQATAIAVNTSQATVQDVINSTQIEELPVDGRNFLDLASLEPGVQVQDGSTFDPTKNGFSSISFGGRAGRTARIEVDGLDISDETVGTTTQNLPLSAIEEFNVNQSSLDLATELTSSGSVNIISKSGNNDIHGQLFYFGRSNRTSAKIAPPIAGQPTPEFGRNQYGGDLGGWFIKDKVFYFLDAERTGQSLADPVVPTAPFTALAGSFGAPFRESEYVGKLDWNIRGAWKAFFRFSYDQNLSHRGFNPGVYQPFANVDHVPVYAMGTDFSKGRFTNQFRIGYLKFRNAIADATQGVQNPAPGISLIIAPFLDFSCLGGGEAYCSGTNILAPQATFQSNKQGKYDGSFAFGSHVLRYGIGVNRILGGGFAKFFGIAPAVGSILTSGPGSTEDFANNSCGTGNPCFPGGASNPLNYPVQNVLMGNGQGFFTEIPQFGFPAGGQFDTRFFWYVGDSWKATKRLTITYGVHYVRDTGRSDSDLAAIPALNQFGPGLGNAVHQPNKNFSPHLGIALDPTGTGKTVFRAGGGIYYENAIFNNVLFDRPARLQKGLFFGTGLACIFGSSLDVPLPNGSTMTPTFCGQPIGNVVNDIATFQQQYQAAVVAAGPQSNGSFVGNTLAEGVDSTGDQLIAPNYRSPYSVQMNAGIQRQVGHGSVLTVDYVRNVSLHYLLGIDVNHVGAARTLNVPNAQAAISATNAQFTDNLGNPCTTVNCAINAGASIVDYANNGLDSGTVFAAGFPCPTCAFPGLNPNLGQNQMLMPIGRSVYNALQISLKSNLDHPLPGMHRLSLLTSYALSRFNSQASDQDFINNATDFDNPNKFFGPSGLDRTHILGVGATMDFPGGTRLSMSSHWATAGALTLTLPNSGNPGEIFRSDVTGDGTVGDVVPGTNIGSFDRNIKATQINNLINSYNGTGAGQLTPAGQALVGAGLFTQAQLVALGAVTPTLALAPKGQVGMSPRFTTDMYVSWRLHPNKVFHGLSERAVVEPQVGLFNVFNFQNWDPGGNTLSGSLTGTAGTANGTTRQDRTNLVSPGAASGVNWYGVPRQWQFGVKLTF